MKLSNDQMDALIYFLLYCIALGVIASGCALISKFFSLFKRR